MLRRTFFNALAMAAAPLSQGQEPEPSPAVQWHPIVTAHPVNVPAASDALTKYGIGVEIFSDHANVEAFVVTARYQPTNGEAVEQTRLVMRAREIQGEWTSTVFWTGEPVRAIMIRARELVFNGCETTLRA